MTPHSPSSPVDDPGAAAPALRGGRRCLRVAVLGSVSLALATTAHLAGGGMLPGVGVWISLAVVLGVTAAVLTGRRLRLPGLLVVLGLEQVALHWALEVAGRAACLPLPTGIPGASMGHPPVDPHVAAGALACASVMDGHTSAAMVLAHAAATVATAWLLARGEAAMWRLADQVVRAAQPVVTGLPTPPCARQPVGVGRPSVPVASADPHRPRGPPVLSAAC